MKSSKPYNSDWGWWFSGLVDGEGSFVILFRPAGENNPFDDYRPIFSMGLRADDRAVLDDTCDVFGGHVHIVRYEKKPHDIYDRHPQYQWQMQGIKDVLRLVKHFDKFPLKSKKAKDYQYWRLAVIEVQKPYKIRSQERIRILRAAIKEARKFESDINFIELAHDPQLPLDL